MELTIRDRQLGVIRSEEVDGTASAVRLSPPPNTSCFRITAGTTNLRWRDFGVPDANTGHELAAGDTFLYLSDCKTFRIFGGKAQVTYCEALA